MRIKHRTADAGPADLRVSLSGLWLAAIVVAAFALRVWRVDAGTLELDEGYTLIIAARSPADIMRLAAADASPALGYLLFHFWGMASPSQEYWWELFSVLAGTLAVFLMARASRLLFGPRAAIPGAFFLTISLFHIDASQKIRVYSIAIVALLLTIETSYRFATTGSRKALAGFVAAAFFLTNLHYYGLLLMVPLLSWSAWTVRADRRRLLTLLAGCIMLGVLDTPTLWTLSRQYRSHFDPYWIAPPSLRTLLAIWVAFGSFSVVSCLTISGMSLVGLVRQWRRPEVRLCAALLVIPLLLALALSLLGKPLFHLRYSVYVLIPYLLLATAGFLEFRKWQRMIIAAVLAASFSVSYSDYVQGIVDDGSDKRWYAYLRERYEREDVILHTSKCSFSPALFYLPAVRDMYVLQGSQPSPVFEFWLDRPYEIAMADLSRFKRVWLFGHPCEGDPSVSQVEARTEFQALLPKIVWSSADSRLRLYQLDPR